jgi:hypothetical protein
MSQVCSYARVVQNVEPDRWSLNVLTNDKGLTQVCSVQKWCCSDYRCFFVHGRYK